MYSLDDRPPPAMPSLTPETLVECIRNLTSDAPRREHIQRYVELAHALAEASVRTSRFHRSAELGIHSRSDLALDAISDLFERDLDGRFVRLIRYFEEQDFRQCDARELWTLNRRLIAGAVSDALFRNYRESDPSLARIIRNLKRGIQKTPGLELNVWMGQATVESVKSRNRSGACWTIESFASCLIPYAALDPRIPEMMDGIQSILDEGAGFQGRIRLSLLGLAVRECSVLLQQPQDIPETNRLLDGQELDKALLMALSEAVETKREFYLSRGKLSQREFEGIREAIALRLRSEVAGGRAENHYEAFRREFPDVDRLTYRSRYRNAFEYLYRLAFERFSTIVQDWFNESAA